MADSISAFDIAVGALCAWRENRSGGIAGMQSVLNVLANRVRGSQTSIEEEALRPWQFSSMTAKGDPQINKGPDFLNPADLVSYRHAVDLANQLAQGNLPDLTGGATSYYAASMPAAPAWAQSMDFTVEIAGQRFYRKSEET